MDLLEKARQIISNIDDRQPYKVASALLDIIELQEKRIKDLEERFEISDDIVAVMVELHRRSRSWEASSFQQAVTQIEYNSDADSQKHASLMEQQRERANGLRWDYMVSRLMMLGLASYMPYEEQTYEGTRSGFEVALTDYGLEVLCEKFPVREIIRLGR